MALASVTYTLTFNGAMTLDTQGHDAPDDLAAFIAANYDPQHLVSTASFDGISVTNVTDVPNPAE